MMRFFQKSTTIILALVLLTALSACSSSKSSTKLEGTRIAVLSDDSSLKIDERIAALPLVLPDTVQNSHWTQEAGQADHVAPHGALADKIEQVWQTSIGAGSNGTFRLLARPVAAGGRVYTMDATGEVRATLLENGEEIWAQDTTPEINDKPAMGGGLALDQARLYATTGHGEVLALDLTDGHILWRRNLTNPIRAAPAVENGRVFAVTIENKLTALSAEDGAVLWTHSGIVEPSTLSGMASPAVSGDSVVVAYSSGELFSLRVQNGRLLWTDSLAALRKGASLAGLSDIRAAPVVDRSLVIGVGHAGRMTGIDLSSGSRLWDADIGGVETPVSAGDTIFVLSGDQRVLALTRSGGKVRWVTDLPSYQDAEEKKGLLFWTGPVLAGNRLWVAGSNETLVALSPKNGVTLETLDLPDAAYIAPIIVDRTLLVVTDDGTLTAFR
jgi:outer membrane protein assembly factor BamB